ECVREGVGWAKVDFFQGALYGMSSGSGISTWGAIAYGSYRVQTDRATTALGPEQLRAEFTAHDIAARVETRFEPLAERLSPYAALPVQHVSLPAYAETATHGAGASALSYTAREQTIPRTELGAWFEQRSPAPGLMLRGRVAWAHNFHNDAVAVATFQLLPTALFTVRGA